MTVTEGVIVNVIPNSEHEYLMPTSEVAIGYGCTEGTFRNAIYRHGDELLEGKHWIKTVTNSHTLVDSTGVTKRDTRTQNKNLQTTQTFWTKRGIVRLGFFIKSERAKLFRNWAEDLKIKKSITPRIAIILEAMEIVGGQRRLSEHLGIGESTLSEIVHEKGKPGKEMIDFVTANCQNIVALGIPVKVIAKRPVVRNQKRVDNKRLTALLVDVCRIEDTELRLSIVSK